MAHTDNRTSLHESNKSIIAATSWGDDIEIDTEAVANNLRTIVESIVPCKPRIIGVTKYFD